jgi:hypothetical protein
MSLPLFEIKIVWKCDQCGARGEGGCWGQPAGQRLPSEDEARQLGLPMHWLGEFGATFCGAACMCAWARAHGYMAKPLVCRTCGSSIPTCCSCPEGKQDWPDRTLR